MGSGERHTNFRAFLIASAALVVVLVLELLRGVDGVDLINQVVLRDVGPDRQVIVEGISYTASLEVFAVLTAIAYFLDVGVHRSASKRITSFAVAIIFSMIVTTILKAYVMEPRPHEPFIYFGLLGSLLNADYYGFPSGHTVRVTVLAYYFTATPSMRRKGLSYIVMLYAAVIMFTRLLLQVHWLWDIVGGIVVGAWSSILVNGIGERLWVPLYNATLGRLSFLRLRQ
ncbi:phosphatase PAP2 family protein [Acidilobus sp.]|jgi:undecaprenyl-diphosphatase|uniref:phosphatase PAP2 family protein n=1 Tax=Acidilobus sp. TaxID=1872109 RepID=UPI003CFF47DA